MINGIIKWKLTQELLVVQFCPLNSPDLSYIYSPWVFFYSITRSDQLTQTTSPRLIPRVRFHHPLEVSPVKVKVEAELILVREGFEPESFEENKLLSPKPSSGGLLIC